MRARCPSCGASGRRAYRYRRGRKRPLPGHCCCIACGLVYVVRHQDGPLLLRHALAAILPGDDPLEIMDAGCVCRGEAWVSISLDLSRDAVGDERATTTLLNALAEQLVAWDRSASRPARPDGEPVGALTPLPGGTAAPGEPVPRSTGARGHTGEGEGPTAVYSWEDRR